MEDEENYANLSIEDRLNHKSWKARQGAYEELRKLFQQAVGPQDAIFREYFDAMRKAPSESNAAALDTALSTLHSYVESADMALKLRSSVLGPLIEKGLGAVRAGSRAKSIEILLEFVAIDEASPIIDELASFLGHKQPKLVAASVNSITEIVKNFGATTAGIKSILKLLPRIFQHADKNVRGEGSSLVLEMARWIGSSAVSVGFEGLKPVQIKELQESMAKLPPTGKPVPLKWRRCEKPSISTGQSIATFGASNILEEDISVGGCKSTEEIIDAYTLSEPVDVLEKIPSTFQEGIDSAKWKDRKDALEALLAVIKVPKIKDTSSFGPLINILVKRISSDSNVSVVISAAQCVEALAKGLRRSFTPFKSESISAMLERCKEKNKNVIEALRGALDSLSFCISSAAEVTESINSFFKHKNPQVKAESLLWLSRILPTSFKTANIKKEIKIVSEAVLPCMDDGSADVRDAATNVLSILVKVAGEKNVLPFVDKLDKIKLTKVLESAKESVATTDSVSAQSTSSAAAAVVKKQTDAPLNKGVAQSAEKINTPHSAPNTQQLNKVTSTSAAMAVESQGENIMFTTTDEESVEVVLQFVGLTSVDCFKDSNWKVRLESFELLASKLEISPTTFSSETLVRFFLMTIGWKESNFQVLSKIINTLSLVAEKATFTTASASLLLPGSIEKISDIKVGTGIAILLTSIAEHVGLNFVINTIAEPLKIVKNPKSLAETLNWIAMALLDFGPSSINVKSLSTIIKDSLKNTNPVIKSAAIKAATNLRRFLGPNTISMFAGDVPPAQLALLETEFQKVANEPTPLPIRRIKTAATPSHCAPNNSSSAIDGSTQMEVEGFDDLIPRNDITSTLNSLIPEVGDSNWKVRKEAMEKALALIQNAGNRILLHNNDFISELKGRFGDANKNLISQALDLASSIAVASGVAFDRSSALKIILAPAISTLADNKPQVRAAAIKFLSSVASVSSLSSMSSAISSSLASDSPNLRRELLGWLAEIINANAQSNVSNMSEEDKLNLCTAIVNCLLDRTLEVRKAASLCIDNMIDLVGSDYLLRTLTGPRGNLQAQLRQIIDSHKPASVAVPKTPVKSSIVTSTAMDATSTPKKDSGRLFINIDVNQKTLRGDAEIKGTLKWCFDSPRLEFCDHLKSLMMGNISNSLTSLLFADDFKEAVNGLILVDNSMVAGVETEGVLANSDLILKYLTIRFFDTNTTILIKTIDVLEHLLGLIDENNLRMSEAEASSFFPHFVMRAGEFKEPVKGKIRGIYRQLCRVYPASKIFTYIIDGLKSKSSRTRVECLNEIAVLISRNGSMVLQASKHIPIIASLISDRDSQVRNAALDVLVQLRELFNEDDFYRNLDNIPQKDIDMFNERMRRSKDRTATSTETYEMLIDNEVTMDTDSQPTNMQSEDQQSASIPQVFHLDSHALGNSPPRTTLSLNMCSTPLANKQGGAGIDYMPTPALPNPTGNPFIVGGVNADCSPLDRIIGNISSSTDFDCIAALKRLDEFMAKDCSIIIEKLDGVVNALSVRLHECCDHNQSMIDTVDYSMKSQLCRYVVNALLVLVTDPNGIIKNLDGNSVTLLLRETLLSLVSERVELFEDRESLKRGLNALLVKSLDKCNRNACYKSLFNLMKLAFKTPPSENNKYPEFVMKSLWKLTKVLPTDLTTEHSFDKLELLRDIHAFFSALPPMEWKERAAQQLYLGDLPLRTVKTILNEIATTLREDVVPIVREMENCENSFVTSYLRAMLSALNVDISGLDFNQYPTNHQSTVMATEVIPQMTVEELEERLKDICNRICSQPNTRLALAELYELQKKHSYATEYIEGYLQRLGDFFYKYIRRNLSHIDAELSRSQLAGPSGNTPIEQYKAKLAHMQSQILGGGVGGLATSASIVTENAGPALMDISPIRNRLDSPMATKTRTPLRPSNSESMMGSPMPTDAKDSTIVSLKERLAKLRSQGHA